MKSKEKERRDEILAASERLFRHYGPAKTTIADIAREVGIGVGSVYLEFPSKEAIVQELSEQQHLQVLAALELVVRSSDSFADKFSRFWQVRVRMFYELRQEGTHACDLFYCHSSTIKAVHRQFLDQERAILSELLAYGDQRACLERRNFEELTQLLQQAFHLLSPPWLYEKQQDEAHRQASTLAELLLHGVLKRN
jgi:AcrR family transcriptional regulator